MNETNKQIIWLFDDNTRELRLYKPLFEKALPKDAEVRVVKQKAFPHKEDYLDIIGNPNTGCLLIDQRLKESGEVDHTGIELASYLRAINDKLPIYILTNFADETDEFTGGEWSVEDIIPKKEVGNPEKLRTVVARMLRRMRGYRDLIGDREKRFRYLLKKSLDEELNDLELQELEELKFFRASAILASELPLQAQLEKMLRKIQGYSSASVESDTGDQK